jgi:hypothetical protein
MYAASSAPSGRKALARRTAYYEVDIADVEGCGISRRNVRIEHLGMFTEVSAPIQFQSLTGRGIDFQTTNNVKPSLMEADVQPACAGKQREGTHIFQFQIRLALR